MELTGKIKLIGQTQTIKNFRKRDIVIETEEQYPQTILIQFSQDKTTLLENFVNDIGQKVKIKINIRGREWVSPQGETKYFNTIEGWSIGLVIDNKQKENQQPVTQGNEKTFLETEEDDLQF